MDFSCKKIGLNSDPTAVLNKKSGLLDLKTVEIGQKSLFYTELGRFLAFRNKILNVFISVLKIEFRFQFEVENFA